MEIDSTTVSKARIEVDDVFEDLINDIDVKVELFLAENSYRDRHFDQLNSPFTRINEWREACIEEIRACKDYNLSLIDSETARLPLEQRVKRFCFLASFMDTVLNCANQFEYTLFSTDRYLSKAEITCFETLLKFMPGAAHDPAIEPEMYNNYEDNYMNSINELFAGVEEDVLERQISNDCFSFFFYQTLCVAYLYIDRNLWV
jgi:hypothetical protein